MAHRRKSRRTSFLPSTAVDSGWTRPGGGLTLGRAGRWSVVSVVTLSTIASFFLDWAEPWTITRALGLAVVGTIALFAWRPGIATSALIAVSAASAIAGAGPEVALILAIALGLVVYCGNRPLLAAYALFTGALMAVFLTTGRVEIGGAITLLAIGIASGVVGFASRSNIGRRIHLEGELARRERDMEEAIQQERQRMSDELHDIVAHDITIVAMHANALPLADDDKTRAASTRAIADAAGQALVDIRRLLRVSPGGDAGPETTQPRTLLDIVVEIQSRLRAADIPVECVFEPSDVEPPTISLHTATTLAQVARETTNNVIVHAPRAPVVRVVVTITTETVGFSIGNDLPRDHRPRTRGGYGLARMQERVRLIGGTFSSGRDSDGWLAVVAIPRD